MLVEAPTYDRPLKLLALAGRRDGRARRWTTRGSTPMRSRPSSRAAATSRSSTRSRPSRTRAAARSARSAAGGSPSSPRRTTSTCSRTTRTASSATRATAPPSLHELEGGEHVTFTSSFSKTVAPGLRVGWFVVPEGLRAAYDDRAVSTYISPPLLPQAIVHELFARGAFEPNLERIRGILRAQQRRDARRARRARCRARRPGAAPRAATSSGSTSARGVDAAELLGARPRRASRSSAAPTSSRRDGGGERRPARVLVRAARADRRGRRASSPACCNGELRPRSGLARPRRRAVATAAFGADATPPAGPKTASAAPSAMLSRISHESRVLTVKKTKRPTACSLLRSRNASA